jgi:hypothetical protein
MRLDQVLNDRQPKTGSSLVARPGLISAIKSLEHPCQMLMRDARAIIGDGHGST